ncbi:hypothetical protein BASA81_015242 [Batrachochytrium salamandrivorans]|nr:hypothetical protein BASA81_015242 [Batrachochytrium salamandrivorans]
MVHSASDICIIGEKGCGKSAVIRLFSKSLGYQIEYIPLHRDMSARDLLQRRSTLPDGDTFWENSGLVEAALHGRIAVLDQIEVLGFGTISSIQRLAIDREISLPDGRTLIGLTRFRSLMKKHGYTFKDLVERQILPIHPSFRIIAVARPTISVSERGSWMSPELVSMFLFVPMRSLTQHEESHVIQSLYPHVPNETIHQLCVLATKLRSEQDDILKMMSASCSTRHLLRIARHLTRFPKDSIYEIILQENLFRFLPSIAKEALEKFLGDNGIQSTRDVHETVNCTVIPATFESPARLCIGDVEHPVFQYGDPLLIPDVVFFDNPKQTLIMQDMLKGYILGEHLLLIGNQGVGKNKIVDRFLQLLRLPREYIQLHRDVTVASLTSCPTVINGRLVYEDSPLVRAIREGYILVVDEADKAPTHVTAVLKSLVEDGEMVLSDGRRIERRGDDGDSRANSIFIHPNFRMVVLANRPGFPFLGNDFWREIGDVFACYAVDNPDAESEIQLLKNYAPEIPDDVLVKLISLFNDLRGLVDEGLISYPYSTRELVNTVKHLQAYPNEGLSRALFNVFDFDHYDPDVKTILTDAMISHGIPMDTDSSFRLQLATEIPLPEQTTLEQWALQAELTMRVPGVTQEMHIRGTWAFERPTKWSKLNLQDGRTVVFSELLYTFQLPCTGNPVDCLFPGQFSAGSL